MQVKSYKQNAPVTGAFYSTFDLHYATIYGPRRKKTCLRGFENNTGADQPAHLGSLILAFIVRFLESTIFNPATGKISIF